MMLAALNTLGGCVDSTNPRFYPSYSVACHSQFCAPYRFERVYPIPDWVTPPKEEPERKRRRRDSDCGSESSGSEMDLDEDQVSAPPLSVFLQSNQGWSRNNDRKSGAKLRPEVLDIARLVDANKNGGSMVRYITVPWDTRVSNSRGPIVWHKYPIIPPLAPSSPLLRSRLYYSAIPC